MQVRFSRPQLTYIQGDTAILSNATIKSYLTPNTVQPTYEPCAIELLPAPARALVGHYAALPGIRLIMTIGSLARAQQDKHSDVDIVLVCSNEGVPPKELRSTIISRVSRGAAAINGMDVNIWSFGTSDDFTIDGQEICTQFFTTQYMQERLELITSGFYTQVGMEYPLASLSGILGATVHIDKDDFYRTMRRTIDPYPEKLQKIILGQEQGMRLPYYLGRLETAIARKDLPFADKMIHSAVDSALYILFATHKRYPNGPKRLYEQISSFMPAQDTTALKHCLAELIGIGVTVDNLPHKQTLLNELARLATKTAN